MTKRIKWVTNDVDFSRGNYEVLIVKLGNCKSWLAYRAFITTQGFKANVKDLAQTFGSRVAEIKPLYIYSDDGESHPTESNIIGFMQIEKGKYFFSIDLPVPEGAKRNIKEFSPDELFM